MTHVDVLSCPLDSFSLTAVHAQLWHSFGGNPLDVFALRARPWLATDSPCSIDDGELLAHLTIGGVLDAMARARPDPDDADDDDLDAGLLECFSHRRPGEGFPGIHCPARHRPVPVVRALNQEHRPLVIDDVGRSARHDRVDRRSLRVVMPVDATSHECQATTVTPAPTRRRCPRCQKLIGWQRRSDARYCSAACRQAAFRYKDGYADDLGAELLTPDNDVDLLLDVLPAGLSVYTVDDFVGSVRCELCRKPLDWGLLVKNRNRGQKRWQHFCSDTCLLDSIHQRH